MCVCEMVDLPGCSVAITSMCTTKLEHFVEYRTCGRRNFDNKFLEMVFQLLQEIIIYKRNWSIKFLEKLW